MVCLICLTKEDTDSVKGVELAIIGTRNINPRYGPSSIPFAQCAVLGGARDLTIG